MYVATGPVTLRTNLADYALTIPLRNWLVPLGLAQFDFCGPTPAYKGFKSMVGTDNQYAFDAGELAIVTYLMAKDQKKPLTLLPAVVMARPQHDHIVYDAGRLGELRPGDMEYIEGLRIGVRSLTQTTVVWARAILKNQYGVDLSGVTWVCTEDPHLPAYKNQPNVERWSGKEKALEQMLKDRDIDVAIGISKEEGNIRRLITDHSAAQRWYHGHRTPINHLFVVNSQLSEERPDVVAAAYQALKESKKAAGLPGEGNIDFHPFGITAVSPVLHEIAGHAFQQGLTSRRLEVSELFDANTIKLD